MKVLITIIALFATTANGFAQQKISLKPQLTPDQTYVLNFKGHIEYDVVLNSKSPIPMLKLEEAGMKLPLHVVEATTIKATAVTGVADAKEQIPLTLKYDQARLLRQVSQAELDDPNDNTINPLAGKSVTATVNPKGVIKVISSDDARLTGSDINRQDMINLFNLQGTSKNMQPGDTYTLKDVVNLIDMGTGPITVKRERIYKLTEITGSKANFDITQKISSSFTNDARFNSEVTGAGTGKMTFDLDKKIPVELIAEMTVKVRMPFTPTDAMEISYHSMANNNLKIE